MTDQIIKADPGWFVARFANGMAGPDGWPDYLSLDPIIAWHVEYDPAEPKSKAFAYEVTPLTVNGSPHATANPWVIKTPEGAFLVDGCLWSGPDAQADVIAELKQAYSDDLKERAARHIAIVPKPPA